MSVMQAGIGIP